MTLEDRVKFLEEEIGQMRWAYVELSIICPHLSNILIDLLTTSKKYQKDIEYRIKTINAASLATMKSHYRLDREVHRYFDNNKKKNAVNNLRSSNND